MPGIVLKLFGLAILGVSVLFMVASAFRQSRRLNARIRAHKEEQRELARLGKVEDPYAALSEIYKDHDAAHKEASRSKGRIK